MAARLGKSERTIERATRELRSAGRLTRIGPDKGGHWEVTDGE
jgi:predicted HTH transcriptional regulator